MPSLIHIALRIELLRHRYYTMLFCLVILTFLPLHSFSADNNRTVEQVFSDLQAHDFHPMDKENSFTLDKHLGKAGIADINDKDWEIRLLAIRDLVRAGEEKVSAIINGLSNEHKHVRMTCAASLGILRAEDAITALEKTAQKDPSSLVRSQAVIALGQINSKDSLPVLQSIMENDSSRDVTHQAELSIDQIQKQKGATPELLSSYQNLDSKNFHSVSVGKPAVDFRLQDTQGKDWELSAFQNNQWVILIWIFADWCPVCHSEFRDLIQMKDEFVNHNIQVFTIEQHDTYRGSVMIGKELEPTYWFAEESFQDTYTNGIWWNHLLDRSGSVGAAYGVDPMAFAVHAEYVNRPSTVIIDPSGIVRFAYYGTYWGDRPTIHETVEMIQNEDFSFTHPKRLKQK